MAESMPSLHDPIIEAPGTQEYPSHMAANIEDLARQAMSLPPEARARLADLLVESLDADQLGRVDQLWLKEAKRRRDDVRSGRVQPVPGDEALRAVRDALRQ